MDRSREVHAERYWYVNRVLLGFSHRLHGLSTCASERYGQGFAEGISSIPQQLGVQAIGVAATFVYTAIVTFILLKVVGMITGLRVSSDEETQGLDIIDHEERGY